MIARWRKADLGEVHRLYPFRDPVTGGPLTDRPERAGADDHAELPTDGPWTGLDARALQNEVGGHDEVGRWLSRRADVLVVIWNGDRSICSR